MYTHLNTVIKGFVLGLSALFSCHYANANVNSLAGIWEHNHQQTIIKIGHNFKLLFCNEQGNCAEGINRGAGLIFVPKWNVTGSISRHNNIISWSNGTQWVRYNKARKNDFQFGRISIQGPWRHDGKPTSIQMQADGIHFTLVNEAGQFSQGYINKNRELVLPSLNITGRLHKHGNVIKWSNNTAWHRP